MLILIFIVYFVINMQFLNKIQGEYDQLWKYIVRPTRTPYPDTALGP